ncbi:hypothetical protein RB602_12820 [Parasphingorhabdus sp. SCSIO 66989]|uniref:Uncharacterized protein n=2 Tax=Alterisphingorhabdus coralli TaxID=3071408 RepID=A0AA97HZI5_9SPHN|nr:hypothetical protein [Parasphingorhabdus sp. SCSIO 66989]WOE74719.1 hypothetical protein RB602_12820 [Parasphingorhabdus sp. SCSIO 66989]
MTVLRTVERFLRRHDMPRTKFGRLAARDPRLVDDMRNGREPRKAMRERIEHFMNRYEGERTHADAR